MFESQVKRSRAAYKKAFNEGFEKLKTGKYTLRDALEMEYFMYKVESSEGTIQGYQVAHFGETLCNKKVEAIGVEPYTEGADGFPWESILVLRTIED